MSVGTVVVVVLVLVVVLVVIGTLVVDAVVVLGGSVVSGTLVVVTVVVGHLMPLPQPHASASSPSDIKRKPSTTSKAMSTAIIALTDLST